jgi:predicted ATPase/class 3 adenylate cyclase/Tfp pilus assembly protein PilF
MHEDEAGSTAPAGVAIPTSILTFLFTDVEGSTPLWERHEALMRQVAARHDALLDGIITQHQGRRVKERGEGDSIFATFAHPADAAAAALTINRAVLAEPWPAETPIKVRMSLHTGIAQCREGDYYGTVVNRCARMRGLGHGGQILLSSAMAALVRGRLPAGASLRCLGLHVLKGLSDPEEVFQLCHPRLPDAFPPLLSPQAPRHNLSAMQTGLIGRERELSEVLALLGTERLVTLTGTGGVGKTRLALAVAAEVVDQYPDGVWQVELAPRADPVMVPGAVARVLRLREEPGRSILSTVTDHLQNRALLLVLDNCEHLVGACAALVGTLLRAAPGLRVLATSREGLQVGGEQLYQVPSLAVPDPKHLPPRELVGSYEAVRLFVARARAQRREFVLDERNSLVVAMVCARLDGIPLAIELAAARAGTLPVEVIAARLDHSIKMLTGGPRDVLPRHQTLRATLDWSHDLLSRPEQVLLRRLAVFAGGWILEAAEQVCTGEAAECGDVLDLLSALVKKSLVLLEEAGSGPRYRLLETVRQYAREQLEVAGETAQVGDQHLAWCLALAEEAEPALVGPEQEVWLVRLEAEHDNVRAALAWARERAAGERGLRLAGALWRFWDMRGDLGEGRSWLEAALASSGPAAPLARARALNGAGNLAEAQGDYRRALALHAEALAVRRALGDTLGIAGSLNNLGNVAYKQADYARAAALYEESLALKRELGDTLGMAVSLNNLGMVAWQQADYARAAALYEESLALRRELGDKEGIAGSRNNLGNVAYMQGDYARAAALVEKSLALQRELRDKEGIAHSFTDLGMVAYMQGDYARATARLEEGLILRRELGDKEGIAGSLNYLGMVAYLQGDFGRATALLHEALLLSRDIGAKRLMAEGLEGLAWVAAVDGQSQQAAWLGGAAERLRQALGVPLSPDFRLNHDQAVQALCAALGEDAFAVAWAAGQALALDQAIALAPEHDEARERGWSTAEPRQT